MSDALIQVVDENDQPVGAASKEEIWEKGLRHRIVRVMVSAPDGRVLLQKRTATKQPYPGCWDHSASGHVDAGESYDAAAKREVKEELGIDATDLAEIGTYTTSKILDGRKLNRFNKVYQMKLDTPVKFAPDSDEVAELRWFTIDEAKHLTKNHPSKVVSGLSYVFERYY